MFSFSTALCGVLALLSAVPARAIVPATEPPQELGAAGEESPTLKGPTGEKIVPIQRPKSEAGTLVFVPKPTGGGYYGQYTRVKVAVLPGTAGAPADLSYDRFLGPLTMKSLGQVMKAMTVMEKGWPQGQKIQFSFIHKPSPSELTPATLAAALALDSVLRNYDIELSYAAVGSLQEDGSVEAVGGIPERLAGAARSQVNRIVVPEKNLTQVADYLLSEGVGAFIGTQIFTVKNFNEAGVLSLPFGKLDPATSDALKLFGTLQRTLAVKQGDAVPMLRSEAVQGVLQKVLATAPNHASAQVLLDWGTGKHAQISFDGSVDYIDRRGGVLIHALRAKTDDALKTPRDSLVSDQRFLRFALERMDPRARPYAAALVRYGDAILQAGGGVAKAPKLSAAAQTTLEAAKQLGNDEWVKMAKERQAIGSEAK